MQIIRLNKPHTLSRLAGLWLCLAASMNSQTLLSPSQQAHAAYLYTRFIAPCCWRQSVAVHQSQESLKVRFEIDTKILLGESDSQIKAALVKEYGHGILTEPEGIRAILAYSLPILAFALGLLAIVSWIRNHRNKNAESMEGEDLTAGPLSDLEFDY